MKIKNVIKIILAAIATILLGALGSGVWEKILSPFLSYIGNVITTTASSLSSTYSDSIYRAASNIHFLGQSGITLLFLMLLVFVGLFIFSLGSKKENKLVSIFHEAFTSTFKGWQGIIASGAFLVFTIFMISTQFSIFEIKGYSLKQMDILRPYIGEQNFHILRSDYLRMKNKKDFDAFLNNLYLQSSKVNVDTDKFKLK